MSFSKIGKTRASAQHVWKTCFAPMKWESWDPDLIGMKDVSGPCETGTTFTFIMKEGGKEFSSVIDEAEENRYISFTSSMFCGCVKLTGEIALKPQPNGEGTEIEYGFETHGCLGYVCNLQTIPSSLSLQTHTHTHTHRWIIAGAISKHIEEGVEGGLGNIIYISETQ